MKKFFILLAVWFVAIVAIVIGSQIYQHYQAVKYDELAVPYITSVIPKISQWNPEATRQLMAPEVLDSIPEEKFVQIMALFSRMGALQSMGAPEFKKVHSDEKIDGAIKTVVIYDVAASYENGDALITLNLLERSGTFELYRFNLSSNALLE